ncbi:hypothetical protein BU14_2537s0001, partial [Porphyra umbilicalis]
TRLNKTGGFKIRPRHIERAPLQWQALVRAHGVRIIWQYRNNVLKQAVGSYTIEILGDRTAYEGVKIDASARTTAAAVSGGAPPPPTPNRVTRFKVDPVVLYDILRNRVLGDLEVADAIRLLAVDDCVLPVSYEEYNEDAVLTMHRISTFLGIDAAEAHPSKRAKATSDNLCATVINFGALCAAFYPCLEFRAMLDDERNRCRCAGSLRASAFAPVASSPYCLVKRSRLLAERRNDGASRYHPSVRQGWLHWPLRLRPRGLFGL